MIHILVADDNKTTTRTLCMLAEKWGYKTYPAYDGVQALHILENEPIDILLTDLKMPQMDGMQLLKEVRERWPDVIVIVVTAFGSVETAVEAMKLGAFDFISKPYENKELQVKFQKAYAQRAMVLRLERLDARIASFEAEAEHQSGMGNIIGSSPAMQEVFDSIQKVAPTDSTVLLLGESGTGKEMVAHALHAHSPRKDHPFIPVHCAAYSEGVLESELFGHERGAFTGAIARKIGRFEQADKGTLFLDEIGDISPAIQIKLLRFLQERAFERVGGTKTLHFDLRIVAATNRNLAAEIKEGRFREDLYYRLNVFSLCLPPLRDHKEDIPALVETFCRREEIRLNRSLPGLSPRALDVLMAYDWPGNVRELQNVIERSAILADGNPIDLPHLPAGLDASPLEEITLAEEDVDFDTEMDNFERRLILHAFEQAGRVKAKTAKRLGIDRNRLRYKLKKYGISD